jgi:DeoR family fructose operon transcriptional repressor
MLSLERREAILKLMQQKKAVTVDELSGHFFISEATIRRDLEKMAHEGLVKRTYGGAVLLDGRSSEIPLTLREGENIKFKELIVQSAVELVYDGATLFLDSSSTVSRLVPLLSRFKGLTVVTNALKTALRLGEYGNIRTYCTGGRLRENTASLIGASAKDYLANFNADIIFFACRGLSVENGVTDASEDEAEIKRQMLKMARTKVLLCDSSKIGSVFLSNICPLKAVDIIVTDTSLTEDDKTTFDNLGIKVVM